MYHVMYSQDELIVYTRPAVIFNGDVDIVCVCVCVCARARVRADVCVSGFASLSKDAATEIPY